MQAIDVILYLEAGLPNHFEAEQVRTIGFYKIVVTFLFSLKDMDGKVMQFFHMPKFQFELSRKMLISTELS